MNKDGPDDSHWTGNSLQLVQSYVKGYKLNALGMAALNEVYIQK